MEFAEVGPQSLAALGVGAALAFVLPLALAVIWKVRKRERFSTMLVGAATFLLFALILEKPIQNVLLFPTMMGLPEHAASRFINARPVLLAFLTGLFPGVFEETGRLVAYRTVLKKRKNRETSISHGIGHGGFEVMYVLGVTFITYLSYAMSINAGTFGSLVDQVAAAAPDQADTLKALAGQLSGFTFVGLAAALAERVFAVLFHIGASILLVRDVSDVIPSERTVTTPLPAMSNLSSAPEKVTPLKSTALSNTARVPAVAKAGCRDRASSGGTPVPDHDQLSASPGFSGATPLAVQTASTVGTSTLEANVMRPLLICGR